MLQFGICGAIMTLRSILGHGKHAVVWHVCPYAVVGHGASLMLLFGISGAILNVGLVLGIGQHAGVWHSRFCAVIWRSRCCIG